VSVGLWILIAWLLLPLLRLEDIHRMDAGVYLFRAAIAILILIILLGRTTFDLFMPQAFSKKTPAFQTALLVLYSLLIAAGIIFMVARVVELYVGNVLSDATL